MPKAFTDSEKEHIRSRLKEKGTEVFAKYGVKKTTVDDLVKAVGISKGSFFTFFSSKEELFYVIFSENFNKLNSEFKKQLDDKNVPLKKAFSDFLKNRYTVENNPLLSVFYNPEDFEYINRKIPQGKLQDFIINDFNDLVSIVTTHQKKHQIIEYNPREVVEVFQALFYLSIRKQDMGKFNKYEGNIIDIFIEMIINYFLM